MNDNLVKQYHAQLFSEGVNISLDGMTLGEAKSKVARIVDSTAGETHFEQSGQRTTVVYDRKGGALIGCISEIEVPQSLSVRQWNESRFPAQRAA